MGDSCEFHIPTEYDFWVLGTGSSRNILQAKLHGEKCLLSLWNGMVTYILNCVILVFKLFYLSQIIIKKNNLLKRKDKRSCLKQQTNNKKKQIVKKKRQRDRFFLKATVCKTVTWGWLWKISSWTSINRVRLGNHICASIVIFIFRNSTFYFVLPSDPHRKPP